MAVTGMSWDAVLDEFDLIRLKAVNDYWDAHPPTHILIAAYLGIKPKNKTTSEDNLQSSDINELATALGGISTGRPDDPMLDLIGL